MGQVKEITLSPACNPRRYVRETVGFLREESGRVAIASGLPSSRKTEFALRCAYHLADREKILFVTSEYYPNVLLGRLLAWYELENISRRDLYIKAAFGRSLNEIYPPLASRQFPIVVIDCLNLMDIEQRDLEKLAHESNISILATRVITETKERRN